MFDFMTKINAAQLLEAWRKAGMVDAEEADRIEEFVQDRKQEQELPLYLHALVGIGAFIASLCFIGSLVISQIIDDGSEIIWGIVFMGAGWAIAKFWRDDESAVMHSIIVQSSFCAMSIGKILFVIGFPEAFDQESKWGLTLALLVITAATYPFYRLSLDRFSSALAFLLSLLVNIVYDRHLGSSAELLLNLFFLVQILLAGFMLTYGKLKSAFIPLAYAIALSLCATVLFFAAASKIGGWENRQPYNMIFVNAVSALSLIGLIAWAAGGLSKLKKEPLMLASLGSVLLGVISAPGLIVSIGLMVLGYAKHELLLLVMGGLLMPVFLFLYYYNLDFSLMAKSGVLVGSGLVLLAGRAYLVARKLDRETE